MKKLNITPYLQVAPLALALVVFVGVPLFIVGLISFFEFDDISYRAVFTLENYNELFLSGTTWHLLASTLKYTVIVWLITLLLGFTCSYFLVFHIRSLYLQLFLFLLCTIPFWTSIVIRMISWIPFLGKEGIFNNAMISMGLIDQPLEFLLFSDFSVILSYVHLFTLFMMAPIFNSMARIDKSLLEAATDAGASSWNTLVDIIIPLSKTGIALGSIFVITLVMGDFFVVKIMSGGQSATVVSAMKNEIDQLYYPPASASAVFLIVIVMAMITAVLKVVDVRKELTR